MGTRLPDDFRCGDCIHIARCNYLMGVLPENYECDFDPPKFTADVLVIYNKDGTTTEVEHPFDALKQCKEHNEARR